MESEAMAKIRETLGDALGGEEVEALWHEYEEGVTPEAKLLKVRTQSATVTSAPFSRDVVIETPTVRVPRICTT